MNMKVNLDAPLRGRYILKTYGPDGKLRRQLEFDNLITDNGLDLIYTAPGYAYGFGYYCNNCCVGTGNTAPTTADTSLAALLASIYATSGGNANMTRTYVAGPPAYWKATQTYTFSTGAAAGNLTEIGTFATSGAATSLFSRALILDGEGNPTTLVVAEDEILTVTYELRVYLDTDDIAGTFESDGVTYDTVLRISDVDVPPQIGNRISRNTDNNMISYTVYDGALGTILQQPTGNSYSVPLNQFPYSNYSNGDYHTDVSAVVPVGSANWANGVRAIYVASPLHKFQMSFNDPLTGKGIPKVVGEQMAITFRFSWSRYAP